QREVDRVGHVQQPMRDQLAGQHLELDHFFAGCVVSSAFTASSVSFTCMFGLSSEYTCAMLPDGAMTYDVRFDHSGFCARIASYCFAITAPGSAATANLPPQCSVSFENA